MQPQKLVVSKGDAGILLGNMQDLLDVRIDCEKPDFRRDLAAMRRHQGSLCLK
jgi:hypothetical protein